MARDEKRREGASSRGGERDARAPLAPPPFRDLRYEVRDGTAWITLARPEVLNAFSSRLYGELKTAVRLADVDEAVDTAVITGTGRAFATGGDLEEGLRYLEDEENPLELFRFEDSVPYDAIRSCTKVVIAAVNGICVAGGLIAAMSSDIVVAAESATFGIPEGRIGMAEPWVPNLLFGRVSLAHLKYLALTGKTITAEEARALGMVPLVVSDEDLEAAVEGVIKEVRSTTPAARRRYKELVNRLVPYTPAWEASAAMRTPGAADALRAFAERKARRPRKDPDG